MDQSLAMGLAIFAGFVFCVVVHEVAHAVVASWCGDDTARLMGRITLNPLPHIDPVMSVILPLLLYLSNMPIFGGAKPVPVNMQNLRHPLRDMMFVAVAGPLSNLLLAVGFGLLLNLTPLLFGLSEQVGEHWADWLQSMIVVNVTLALFNLLPIPPLDGSRVLAAVLPRRLGYSIYSPRVQTVGMAVLYLLLSVGGGRFLGPAVVQTAVWIGRLTVFTSLP